MKKSTLFFESVYIAVAVLYTALIIYYKQNILLLTAGAFLIANTVTSLISKLPNSRGFWYFLPPHTFAAFFWCIWFGLRCGALNAELPALFMTVGLIVGAIFTVFILVADMIELKRSMNESDTPQSEDTE